MGELLRVITILWLYYNTGPGAYIATHSVVTAGSVVAGRTEPYGIYSGVPAQLVRKRIIREPGGRGAWKGLGNLGLRRRWRAQWGVVEVAEYNGLNEWVTLWRQ